MTLSEIKLEALDAIIFDCDGVLLESAVIKGQAFLTLFSEFPQHREAIRAHHLENLGVSRFEKFEWIYSNLLKEPLSPRHRAVLGRRYSQLVLDATLACPLVPGALELLEALSSRLPLYVASATPQEELDDILGRRGLTPYFAAIHGSPPAKGEALAAIIATRGFKANRVLMIGDGLSDWQAARQAGCLFLARLDESSPPQPFPQGTPCVRNLSGLAEKVG